MAALDRVRLVKLMMMTTSDSDGEALAAMRLANKEMKKAGINWQELITGLKVVKDRTAETPPSRRNGPKGAYTARRSQNPLEDAERIEKMFDLLFKTVPKGSFRNLVDSIHDYWVRNSRLTQGQYDAIFSAYCRAEEKRG